MPHPGGRAESWSGPGLSWAPLRRALAAPALGDLPPAPRHHVWCFGVWGRGARQATGPQRAEHRAGGVGSHRPGSPRAPLPRQVRQRPECELRGSSWLRLAAPAGSCAPRPLCSSRSVSMMYQKSVPMAAARSTKLSAPVSAAAPASPPRGTRIAEPGAPGFASGDWSRDLEPGLRASMPPSDPSSAPQTPSPAPSDPTPRSTRQPSAPSPSAPSHSRASLSPRPLSLGSLPSPSTTPSCCPLCPAAPFPRSPPCYPHITASTPHFPPWAPGVFLAGPSHGSGSAPGRSAQCAPPRGAQRPAQRGRPGV